MCRGFTTGWAGRVLGFAGMDARIRAHAERTVQAALDEGIRVNVISVRRQYADQMKLWQDYLAGRSRWPANPPGDSAHEYGVAFDATVPEGDYPRWFAIRKAYGWATFAGDPPHAEYPNWRAVRAYLSYS